MIGYALCGSFCTLERSLVQMQALCDGGHELQPILSFNTASIDTRFGEAKEFLERIETICGRKAVLTINDAEPLGPAKPLRALIIAPCTGNTLAKLAYGITDTPVTMAAKAHLRQSRPLLLALATNDAMSANLKNISALLEKKSVYFVPMRQDDPQQKPHSLVAEFELLPECLSEALNGTQRRPLFLT